MRHTTGRGWPVRLRRMALSSRASVKEPPRGSQGFPSLVSTFGSTLYIRM
jgi:hypothetical protein